MERGGRRGARAKSIHAPPAVIHGSNGRQANNIPYAIVDGGRGPSQPDASLRQWGLQRLLYAGSAADGGDDGLGDGAIPEVVLAIGGGRSAAATRLVDMQPGSGGEGNLSVLCYTLRHYTWRVGIHGSMYNHTGAGQYGGGSAGWGQKPVRRPGASGSPIDAHLQLKVAPQETTAKGGKSNCNEAISVLPTKLPTLAASTSGSLPSGTRAQWSVQPGRQKQQASRQRGGKQDGQQTATTGARQESTHAPV